MRAWQHAACGVGVLALMAVEYAPLRQAGLVYEDRDTGVTASATVPVRPRALGPYTFFLQGGASPAMLRATNLGLHVLVSGLVLVFLMQLGASATAAWVGTALFALNALVVETGGYVSSRTELLAALGVLGACIGATAARPPWWALGAAMLGAGLWAKQTALVGLALVPLVWAAKRRRSFWWGGCAALGVAGAFAWYANALDVRHQVAWMDWLLLQSTAAYRLVWLSVWPFGQTVDFDYEAVPRVLQVLSLVGLVSLVVAVCACRRRYPLAALGVCWIAIVFMPRAILQTPYSLLNEHQWYLALVGLAMIAANAFEVAYASTEVGARVGA